MNNYRKQLSTRYFEEVETDKEWLQKQFVEKILKNVQLNKENQQEFKKASVDIDCNVEEKKDNREIEKLVKKYEVNEKQYKEEINNNKIFIKKMKNKVYEKDLLFKKTYESLKSLEIENELLRKQIKNTNIEFEKYRKYMDKQLNSNDIIKSNKMLSQQNKKVISENIKLKKENRRFIKNAESSSILSVSHAEYMKLETKYKGVLSAFNKIKEEKNELLNKTNKYYKIYKIHSLPSELNTKKEYPTSEIKKIANSVLNKNLEKTDKNVLNGLISVEDDMYYFYDLNKNKYPVDTTTFEFRKSRINIPVSCKVENGIAYIVKYFNEYNSACILEDVNNKYTKYKRKTQEDIVKEKKEEFINLGNHRLLIVGIKYKSKYVHYFKQFKLDVAWHNPMEESYTQLRSKARAADMIVICTSHVDHSSIRTIESELEGDSTKVKKIEYDNKGSLLVEIKGLIKDLGLNEKNKQTQ